jgi:hypothetical protein
MKKTDYSEYEHVHADEYYIQRATELLQDKQALKLLYLIGDENGIERDIVNKDKNKKYFKEMIIKYLKG